MPLAKDVATELRKLADGLDKNPDAEIVTPSVYWSHAYKTDPKTPFLALAPLLPRPLVKKYTETEFSLTYDSPAINIQAYTSRNSVCEIVEPAKPAVYRCEPILSADEESSLEVA